MTAAADRELVIDLTRDLIRFRTVNPPGDEEPAAEFLAARMRDLGLQADVQQVEPNRANVIGRLPGKGPGHLVFTGHLDVVPPGEQAWEHDPFSADMVGSRIFGRGACDMKGGVASIVIAMAALARQGFRPSGDIIAAITCGEEAGGVGAQAIVRDRTLHGARFLVVTEPTDLGVFIGEKGVFWVRVRARGRTAHGSMPHLGANAASALARLIPRLEEYPFGYQESPLLGKPSLSVNLIRGGNKTNVVPDSCEIEIDMRTVPGQDHATMLEIIRELAQRTAAEYDAGIQMEAEVFNYKPPVLTEPEDPLARAMVESVRAILGKDPEIGGVPYGTDAAFLGPGFGIPMVICGPGGRDMLHQPNEYVEVEQLERATEIYVDLAHRLLTSP